MGQSGRIQTSTTTCTRPRKASGAKQHGRWLGGRLHASTYREPPGTRTARRQRNAPAMDATLPLRAAAMARANIGIGARVTRPANRGIARDPETRQDKPQTGRPRRRAALLGAKYPGAAPGRASYPRRIMQSAQPAVPGFRPARWGGVARLHPCPLDGTSTRTCKYQRPGLLEPAGLMRDRRHGELGAPRPYE